MRVERFNAWVSPPGVGVAVAVGPGVPLAVALGVAVAVGPGVPLAVADGVALGVADAVAVADGVGVGDPPPCAVPKITMPMPWAFRPANTRASVESKLKSTRPLAFR